MSVKSRAAIAIAFLLASLSCAGHAPRPQQQSQSNEIIVAAAANLTDAFTELGSRWTNQTGVRVRFNYGATADLAKQIENGAPFDLFAAANVEHISELERMKLLAPDTCALSTRAGVLCYGFQSSETSRLQSLV